MKTNNGQLRISIAYWVINAAVVFYCTAFIYMLFDQISMIIEFWDWIDSRYLANLIGIMSSAIFLMVLFSIRRFLVHFRKAEYFNVHTIKSLKKISIRLLIFVLISVLHRTANFYAFTDLYGNDDPIPIIAFYISLTVLAIFIWLVLPAFFAGRELKNETDLTV